MGQVECRLYDLESGNQNVLIPGGADARYVNTGHLVYMKFGTLMGVPFDASTGQLTGAPIALIEGVMQSANTPNTDDETGSGQFAVSTSGTLVYAPGGVSPTVENTLAWVERNGSTTPFTFAPQGPNGTPRISPDGQKIAVSTRQKTGENREIWVYDASRGAPTRLTFDGADSALWSPDGKRVVYGHGSLQIVSADGSAKPETLAETGDASTPTSWTSAADAVVFLKRTQSGANGIWVVPMESGGKPRLFLESRFDLWHPDLSPDGRLMAYVSFESGTPEVYVQSYPGPGEKVRISEKGGFDPLWTAGGRELLYRSADLEAQYFFSAAVRSNSPLQVDAPRLLFQAKAGSYDTTAPERSWHITADGKRFLLLQAAKSTDKPVTVMHVVLNWVQELSRLAPAR